MDTLKRIAAGLGDDITKIISNSTILSADNTHATHPNHPNNSDINNEALLNKGVVIIKDITSTTDAITSSILKSILEKNHIPYQDFVTKNNMNSGSTLSGISLRHVSIDSIDIGIAQLAMHGAKEIIGSMDSYYLYLAFKAFYKTKIIKEKDGIILKD
jgi:aspartyl aminopeptidase